MHRTLTNMKAWPLGKETMSLTSIIGTEVVWARPSLVVLKYTPSSPCGVSLTIDT